MKKRTIVHIDESKCDGCGLCIPNCAEGAIQIIDGKARLVADKLCDGLGDCLGHCPQDATRLIEREAEAFDMQAVEEHLAKMQAPSQPVNHGGCPSSRAFTFNREAQPEPSTHQPQRSELSQWPVQLALVPASAPFLQDADLLITADCVPFAYPDFHRKLLRGKTVMVACPKLDDVSPYVEKLATIFKENDINTVTVARMEVPCCYGLVRLVEAALSLAGRNDIPVFTLVVGVQGDTRS